MRNSEIWNVQSTKTAETPAVALKDAVMRDLLFPWLGLSQSLPLPKFVLFFEPPIPSTEKRVNTGLPIHDISRTPFEPTPTQDPLKAIPKHVADFLLEVYVSRAMSSYPIYYEPWLRLCHLTVFSPANLDPAPESTNGAQPYQIYVVSLMMAVALTTAARSKQARANAMAFKLCEHAMRYLRIVMTNDFRGLQSLVLLHSFAVMNPAAANVYFLSGYIMEACIDLGLHQEEPRTEGVDLLEQDLKRRVFWTAWELDAGCSAGFARPVTLLPKQITTGFPSDFEDSAIHPDFIDSNARKSKFICGQVRPFRLIDAEIVSVLFHNHPLDSKYETFDGWMADVETRIDGWYQSIHRSATANQDPSLTAQWEEMSVFADIAHPLIIVGLFRPCPKVKNPTEYNLMKAFSASVKVAQGYLRQASMGFGSPKYTIQPCHHVFTSAMVFLHALKVCAAAIASSFSFDEIESFMSEFSQFFSFTAERWPAAAKCLDEYHRLLRPLKERWSRYLSASPETQRGMDEKEDPVSLLDPENGLFNFNEYVNEFFDPIDSQLTAVSSLDSNIIPVEWDGYFDFDRYSYPEWDSSANNLPTPSERLRATPDA